MAAAALVSVHVLLLMWCEVHVLHVKEGML